MRDDGYSKVKKRRLTRNEYTRLREEFEVGGFTAQQGLWNIAKNRMLEDRSSTERTWKPTAGISDVTVPFSPVSGDCEVLFVSVCEIVEPFLSPENAQDMNCDGTPVKTPSAS